MAQKVSEVQDNMTQVMIDRIKSADFAQPKRSKILARILTACLALAFMTAHSCAVEQDQADAVGVEK